MLLLFIYRVLKARGVFSKPAPSEAGKAKCHLAMTTQQKRDLYRNNLGVHRYAR